MRNWRYKYSSDESLLKAFASGREVAFECLYTRHKSALFRFLKRQCGHPQVSEEIAHDSWIAVIQQAASFKPRASFKTWLFSIAHKRLIDHWRKQGNTASHGVFEELSESLSNNIDITVKGAEITELVESLGQLSSEQLEAVLLKIEGFSYAEIADITDSKHETVKSRLRYANRHMRTALEVSA